jgi:hypothetical protein
MALIWRASWRIINGMAGSWQMASWPALNNEMANINNGERNEISK